MKRKLSLILIFILLLTAGCTQKVVQPVIDPVALLADAQRLAQNGNYKEAILKYEAVIDIEPNNFDACLGLGRAYKKTGQTESAIDVLREAYSLSAESNIDAMHELFFSYMDVKKYQEAEKLAAEQWEATDNLAAGVLLTIANVALEKYDTVAQLVENTELKTAIDSYIDNGGSYLTHSTMKYAVAKSINPDVFGWITIPGSIIDFPIMKSTSDFYYYNHTLYNEENPNGSIYTYYNKARQGRFYAITGSNARGTAANNPGSPESLFHEVHHIYDNSLGFSRCQYNKCGAVFDSTTPNLQNYDSRLWIINIQGEERIWEVFSTYQITDMETEEDNLELLYDNIWFDMHLEDWGWSDQLDSFNTQTERSHGEINKWIQKQISASEIPFGINVGNEDLLTIVTCGTNSSYYGLRLYYFLHRVA